MNILSNNNNISNNNNNISNNNNNNNNNNRFSNNNINNKRSVPTLSTCKTNRQKKSYWLMTAFWMMTIRTLKNLMNRPLQTSKIWQIISLILLFGATTTATGHLVEATVCSHSDGNDHWRKANRHHRGKDDLQTADEATEDGHPQTRGAGDGLQRTIGKPPIVNTKEDISNGTTNVGVDDNRKRITTK